MTPPHIALAVATAVLWGYGFVTSKYGADHMPPLFFLALRFGLVTLVLAVFARVPSGRLGAVALFSLVMGVGHFGLFYIGLSIGVEASTAAIIWLTQIPLSVILATIMLRERPSWIAVTGIGIAFAGVLVLVGEPRHVGNAVGIGVMFASSVAWAIANIMAKRLSDIPAITLSAWMGIFSTIVLFPLSFIFEEGQIESLLQPDWWLHGSLLYQVVGSTLLAYWAWYFLLARNRVSTVSGFMLLVPLFGFIAGVLQLGEPFTWQSAAGGAAALAGVAMIVLWERPAAVAKTES